MDCSSQGKPTTTVSGIVYDPAGQNPLYNVIVYVPNGPLLPFAQGAVCDQCGVLASGDPLVTALTDPTGRFVLSNVPTGDNVPLVLQLGKWRKQVVIPHVDACTDTPMLDPSLMRLPARRSEGNMPQIAIATGGCDPFECLLMKIGIDPGEFTTADGGGSVHVFQGTGGATLSNATTSASDLWASKSLSNYDLLVNACECGEEATEKPQAAIDNLVAYANAGGRVFNTHYQYYWIDPSRLGFANNPSWATTANFVPDSTGESSIVGNIDMTFPKGHAFAAWLYGAGASSYMGALPIADARYNAIGVNPPSTRWVYSTDTEQTQTANPALLHYTFNTPVGASDDKQCGKVLYSDFHVVASQASSITTFPAECNSGPMSPQELALEFMLFDLSSCIQQEMAPPQPPAPLQ